MVCYMSMDGGTLLRWYMQVTLRFLGGEDLEIFLKVNAPQLKEQTLLVGGNVLL